MFFFGPIFLRHHLPLPAGPMLQKGNMWLSGIYQSQSPDRWRPVCGLWKSAKHWQTHVSLCIGKWLTFIFSVSPNEMRPSKKLLKVRKIKSLPTYWHLFLSLGPRVGVKIKRFCLLKEIFILRTKMYQCRMLNY